MERVRCPACYSFQPKAAVRCGECKRPLRSGVLWIRRVGALAATAFLILGVYGGYVLLRDNRPIEAEIPLTQPVDNNIQADPPLLTQKEPAPEPKLIPPEEPKPFSLKSPPLVFLDGFDAQGNELSSGLGLHLGKGRVVVPMVVIRGTNSIQARGFGEVFSVASHSSWGAVVNIPKLSQSASVEVSTMEPKDLPIHRIHRVAGGTFEIFDALFQGPALDSETGEPRILFIPPSRDKGALIVDSSGKLHGIVIGESKDGHGMASPCYDLTWDPSKELGWTLIQLKSFVHEPDAKSRMALGERYVELDLPELALREMEAAVLIDPALNSSLKRWRIDLRRTIAADLAGKQKYGDAKRQLDKALELDDLHAPLVRDLGLLYLMQRNGAGAVDELRRAIRLDPSLSEELNAPLIEAYLLSAELSLERQNHANAISELSDGVARFPSDGRLQLALGDALAGIREWQRALSAFQVAKQVDPELSELADRGIDRAVRALDLGGVVEIQFPPGQAVVVPVRLDSRHDVTMIMDTGATMTVITRALAERLGFRHLDRAPTVEVETADRRIRVPKVTLTSLNLGTATLRNVDVVVVSQSDWGGAEGLLGLNVLDHFLISLDRLAGRLTLTPR